MDKELIKEICIRYKIKNYTINKDESIDVNDNVNLSSMGLSELPLKFNNILGSFHCHNNKLTSLKGSPKRLLGQYFQCHHNQLTDLEYSPIVEDYTRSSVGMNPLKSISGYNGNIDLLSCENKDRLMRKQKLNNILLKL